MIDIHCYFKNHAAYEVYILRRFEDGFLWWSYQGTWYEDVNKIYPNALNLPTLEQRKTLPNYSHSRPFFEEDLRYD